MRSSNRLHKRLLNTELCHSGLDPESSLFVDSCLRRNDKTCMGAFSPCSMCDLFNAPRNHRNDKAIQLLRSGIRASGIGTNRRSQMVIARAEPVAIYDIPFFLILKPKSWIPNLKRRLPRLAGLGLAMTFFFYLHFFHFPHYRTHALLSLPQTAQLAMTLLTTSLSAR